MKMIVAIATALAAAVSAPAIAAAAPTAAPVAAAGPQDRVVVRERTIVRHERRGWRTRNRCDWRWRGGHRVRVCRSVRYRY